LGEQIVRQRSTDGNLTTFRPVPQPPKIEPVIPLTKYHITSPVIHQPAVAFAPVSPGTESHGQMSVPTEADASSECSPWVLNVADNKVLANGYIQRHQAVIEHCYCEMTPRVIGTVSDPRRPGCIDVVDDDRRMQRCRSDDTLSTTSAAVYHQQSHESTDRCTSTSSSNSRHHRRPDDTPPSSSSSSSNCRRELYQNGRGLRSGESEELLHVDKAASKRQAIGDTSSDDIRTNQGHRDEKMIAARRQEELFADDTCQSRV
jgi:hypothetical protein